MKQDNITELKTDKLFYSKWLIIVLVGLFIGLISFNIPIKEEYRIYIAVLAVLVIAYGLILSQEKIFIKIEGMDFIVEKKLYNNTRRKFFNIKKNRNLEYKLNVKSNFYTSSGQVKVLGINATPESWKKYYYHKEILSFTYEGKLVEIGKWKKKFNVKNIVEEIKNIKSLD